MMRDLVVFGEDWGRHPSSTQHLVKRLAKDRKVIWINSIGMRRPKFTTADIARVGSKVWRMMDKQKAVPKVSVPHNMTIIEPRVIPLPGNPIAAKINQQVLGNTLRKVLTAQNIVDPILWTSLPTAVDLLEVCNTSGVVYYCGDEFGALAGVDHRPVLACERRLSARADLILAASQPLADKFNSGKTELVPHGVDFDLFAQPSERASDLPTDGPVAGFYGSISEWLDQELVAECAGRLPNWTFVFVGEERTDVTRLQKCPNVQFLGPRPHEDLPGYVQHWDVSVMPFVDNEQIRNCNPLKLREYLAAGRPVVATPFPALSAYADILHQAQSAEHFAAAIENAYNETPVKKEERQHVVGAESWAARATQVGALLEAFS